jgi:hypothetical protein
MTKYAVQIMGDTFSLRRLDSVDNCLAWRFYDKRVHQWKGGLSPNWGHIEGLSGDYVPLATEEEALLIILTGLWYGKKISP